jgi:hypothetical protein
MPKNVVFLDIDGVLQPVYRQNRFKHDLEALRHMLAEKYQIPEYEHYDKYDLGAIFYDWDQQSVENLKLLLKETQSLIVLSSSWRRSTPIQVMNNYFRLHDLDSLIIDYTPLISQATRATEVATYLNSHPEITNFVILDDDDSGFSSDFPQQFVYTGKESRFTNEHLRKALNVLSESDHQ